MTTKKNNVLIFTGAGASCELNYPTTKDFMQKYEQNNIFKYIKEVYNTQILDAEVVFEILDRLLLVNDDTRLTSLQNQITSSHLSGSAFTHYKNGDKVITDAMKELRESMREDCYKSYAARPNNELCNDLYNPLFTTIESIIENPHFDIYTTNYDISFDEFFKERRFIDGFDSNNEWSPDLLGSADDKYHLYRLHGSVLYNKDDTGFSKTPVRQAGKINYSEQLLIYPGYKGNPANEVDIISFPHNALQRSIENAEILIFIGFAFRDEWINNAIKSSLKPDSNVIVINPDVTEQIKGIFQNYPNTKFIKDYFSPRSNSGLPSYLKALKQAIYQVFEVSKKGSRKYVKNFDEFQEEKSQNKVV